MPGLTAAPPKKAASDKPARQSKDKPNKQRNDGASTKKATSNDKPSRSPKASSASATLKHTDKSSKQPTQPATKPPSTKPTKATKPTPSTTASPPTTADATDMDVDEQHQLAQPDSAKPAPISASNPFLQLFWHLADDNETKRQQALDKLLTTLTTDQANHTASLPSPPPPASSPDTLHPNLRYALKRLLRGLSSSRAAARTGFAAALTRVLQSFPAVPAPFLLSTFSAQLTLPQSPSKQEQTDFKLGHAVAVGVLCRGGRVGGVGGVEGVEAMVRRCVRDARSKVVRETAWEAVRAVMESVGWKEYKAWMEPFLLKQLAATDDADEDDEDAQTKEEEVEKANSKPKLKKQKRADEQITSAVKPKKPTTATQPTGPVELSSLTPERLSILLAIHDLYRQQHQPIETALSSSLAPSCLSPLSSGQFGALVDILSSAAYTLPTLHSVYGRVFAALLAEDGGSEWVQLYELLAASLFADRTSTAKKHQGLLLFAQLITKVTQSESTTPQASDVAALLHPLLLRTLLNNLSSPDTHLHSVARQAQQALLTAARTQPSVILPLLQRLLAAHGRWDSITKSKTVSTLVSLLTTDDLHRYVHTLMQSFHTAEHKQPAAQAENEEGKEGGEADAVEKHDLWVLDSLYAATRHAALVDAAVLDVALTERVLRFFLFYGFFDPTTRKQQPPPSTKKSKKRKGTADDTAASATADATSDVCRTLPSPLSARVREVCQTRLWSLLDDLLPRSKRQQQQQSQAASDDSDNVPATSNILWSQLAHQYWSETEKAGYALLQPISEEGRQARETMLERVRVMEERRLTEVQSKEGKEDQAELEAARVRARQERGLSILLLHVGMLLLSEEENATALLQELDMGCQQLWKQPTTEDKPKPAKKSKNAKPTANDHHDEDDEEADELQPVFIEVLVDILLSLLVRPSALVRNVCKLVFAAWASEVNERALGDVLRVVVKRAGSGEKKGEGEEDEDDDDEFQPFDVNEMDAEEEEEEEEEEDDDDEPFAKGKQASKKRKAPSPPSQSTDDEDKDEDEDDELIDLDTLDDVLGQPLTAAEQSAVNTASANYDHYDTHLANIIRLRKQHNKSAQDDLANQQTNFQLRALDLLDAYVRLQPASRLVVELMLLPVVDAVKATRKAEKVKGLHERLVVLVRSVARSKQHPTVVWPVEKQKEKEVKGKKGQKKGKAKEDDEAELPLPVGVHETRIDTVRTIMTALMERAKQAADSEHVALLSSSILYLVRLSLPASALVSTAAHSTLPPAVVAHIEFIRTLYHTALTSYLTTRHSHHNTRFFTDYITTAPALAIHSLPLLAQLTRTPLPPPHTQPAQPLAATAFLRLDAMGFVALLCGQAKLMGGLGVGVVEEVGRAVGEGVESMVRWMGLTEEEKKVVREKERERLQDGKEANEENGGEDADEKDETDVTKLSKEERLKLKQKNKKKRRQQRKKQAQQQQQQQQQQAATTAASTTAPTPTTITTTAAEAKIATSRLRATLRSAATVAAAMKRAGVAVDSVVSDAVKEAMRGMRSEDVREVRGVMANLLAVAGVGELDTMKRVREAEEAERRERRIKVQQDAKMEKKAKDEADKVEAIKNKGEERVKKERREKADKQKAKQQPSSAVKVEDEQQTQTTELSAKSENGHTNGKPANGQQKKGQQKDNKSAERTGKENGTAKQPSSGDKKEKKDKAQKKDKSGDSKAAEEKPTGVSEKKKTSEKAEGKTVKQSNGHSKDKQQPQKQQQEKKKRKASE